ncbi:MAG: hypothetical protein ISS25_00145 [Nanoarchaeota archaeon]|nr:hypothetical protein [DPANN group archaeon]MBL7116229.1 hypothetical protein [Nanoarchaeota archaeon]
MNKSLILVWMLVLVSFLVYGHGNETFEEAEQILEDKIACEDLSKEQLESLGDYYMEQMHPGEAHELMDEMMGGEGSDSLKQMHIQMAKRLYCNEDISGMIGGGMMNMMMGGGNMMGPNMMYGYGRNNFSLYNSRLMSLITVFILVIIGLVINANTKKK